MRSWRYVLLALGVATVHGAAYLTLFGSGFALGDGGLRVPVVLQVMLRVLGFPLMYLLYLPPSGFGATRWWGDDANFIIGLTIANSLLWGMGVTVVSSRWRRGRQTK